MPNDETFLNHDDLAARWGVTTRFTRRLVEQQRIHYVKVGRHVRFPLSSVQEFEREGSVLPAGGHTPPDAA